MPKTSEAKNTESSAAQALLEENLEALAALVETLESEETGLEEAFEAYRKGAELVKLCNAQIDAVEKQVMQLKENGEEVPF